MSDDGPLPFTPASADDVGPEVLRARTVLTTRLNKVINRFADRDDLILYCLWRPPGHGEAPAWFDPRAREVTLNAHVGLRGSPPEVVNPLTRAGRRRHPEIVGLLAHEASHAHSTDMSEVAHEFRQRVHAEDPLLAEVMTLLEEPRIEYRQVKRRPHDRYYLRAQSVMIDLAPFSVDASAAQPSLDRWKAANVTLLVCGRVEAGILRSYDAQHLLPALGEVLGVEDLERLREVLREAVQVADGDLDGLLECARQWVQVVGRPPREESARSITPSLFGCGGQEDAWANEPHEEAGEGGEGPGPAGDGDSEGGAEDGAEGSDPGVLTGLGAGLESITSEVATEIADDVSALEAAEAAQTARSEAAQTRKEDAKAAAREKRVAAAVFSSPGDSHPALRGTRPPTSDERRMAQEAGRALKQAQFRERSVTKSASQTPPGRLDGREAMLGAAQRSMGMMATARPFQQRRSHHSPEPPITLGLLADYSGSMGWASGALASVTWVFAHAMTHVEGKMASALFASKVVPLSRPKELPPEVQEYTANSGGHSFGRAHQAINGALQLTRRRGVRLLVVVSDAHYGGGKDQHDLEGALRDLKRAGVVVLWVGDARGTDFPEDAVPVPMFPLRKGQDGLAEHMVSTITDALVEALSTYR